MVSDETRYFVYGTLTNDERVGSVLETWRFEGDGILRGLQRAEGRYPTLVPGGSTTGRFLWTPDRDRFDAYESVSTGLYCRVEVPVTDSGSAVVYVGDPGRVGVTDGWPGEGSLKDRVQAYIETEEVTIEPV